MRIIPVNTPAVGEAERLAVSECLASGWLSSEGPQTSAFEDAFALAHGRRHGIAVSSGTAALDIAVRVLGLGPGDEVLVPSLTIISCGRAIVESGATPVPVDCDARDWNSSLANFEQRFTSRTRAVMLVHLYGLCGDLGPILGWARNRGLAVIEDASQAPGVRYNGGYCGTYGDISAFSLYANKLITTGEGGMLLCDSDSYADRCRQLRNLAFRADKRFWHEELGWNYRMTALQAALGLPQIAKLEALASAKRAMGLKYFAALGPLACFETAPVELPYVRNGYWVFALVVKESAPFSREEIMTALQSDGVSTRTFFYGLHQQPALLRPSLIEPVSLPNTESLSRRGFYLPGGLGLPDSDQTRVIESVLRFVRARS